MSNYIDGFVFPIQRQYLEEYKGVAERVGEIWKEYGALAYSEYIGDDLFLDGTRSFADVVELKENEVVIFGWVVFESREARVRANEMVPNDPRMQDMVGPLTDPSRLIFDAARMVYGGFSPLVSV